MLTELCLYALAAVAVVWLPRKAWRRWLLSRAKHPSLTGHSRMARRLARLLRAREYSEADWFGVDGADAEVVQRRRAGFEQLAALYAARFPKSAALSTELAAGLSDLQFTSRYRVPFQFSRVVRERLRGGAVLQSSDGVKLTDLDGNEFYDLGGSYGVNVFGYDFYKDCIARGSERVRALGPVLGAYHPVIEYNVRRLKQISGLDEVSFHMSGTEAVMQAVRLARYHTRRKYLVRFCGAYHGWWGDVQPGVGNPSNQPATLTLNDMSDAALRVLTSRRDVACVLVNPLQGLHPNHSAPGDSTLVDSGRAAHFDRAAYTAWLQRLRKVCDTCGIVLIFDEVFLGFRLAPGGAQEYFGVRADLVTYGKTLGGGLPVGALCGRAGLMRRFDPERPADICFARGTFNSHPYVMGAMHEFLLQLERPEVLELYEGLDARWDARARRLNQRLQAAGLPVQVATLSTVWTVCYTRPSRYNWMFQYYLRAQGLALSWVGSGRIIFSLNYSDADFEAVADRFVAAATALQLDGWWQAPAELTNRAIRRTLLSESWRALLGR